MVSSGWPPLTSAGCRSSADPNLCWISRKLSCLDRSLNTLEEAKERGHEPTHTGGCRCGAVRFEASGEPFCATYCHCSDCRTAPGAPASTEEEIISCSFRDLKTSRLRRDASAQFPDTAEGWRLWRNQQLRGLGMQRRSSRYLQLEILQAVPCFGRSS